MFFLLISLCFRGSVQCLKLSPNLRKQTPEVSAVAMYGENSKKVFSLERKILCNILEMTRLPENVKNDEDDILTKF